MIVATLGATNQATAGSVSPGGTLSLGDSYVSGSSTVSAADPSVVNNDISGNIQGGSYTYGHGFAGPQAAIVNSAVPANTYGFYDSYEFTIATSTADSITSTIGLSSGATNTQITNLDAQLYMLSGNASLPASNNAVSDSLSTTSFILNSNVSGQTVVLDPTRWLSAGTYILEIRGLATGSAGGSYSGVLNVTPVPLPASAWLLLGGLGILAVQRKKRAGIP